MGPIVVLNGSPRRQGNCQHLLGELVAGIQEVAPDLQVVQLSLYELNLKPCVHCDGCLPRGQCVIRDDMVRLEELFSDMAGLVVAVPIYFSHLCAQAKMMVDRCQPYWVAKYLLHEERFPAIRPGVFIATGGQLHYKSQFVGTSHTMRLVGKILNVAIEQELLVCNTDQEPVATSAERLQQARTAGRFLAEKIVRGNKNT